MSFECWKIQFGEDAEAWRDEFKDLKGDEIQEHGGSCKRKAKVAEKWRVELNIVESENRARKTKGWYNMFKNEGLEIAKSWKNGLDMAGDEAERTREWYDVFNEVVKGEVTIGSLKEWKNQWADFEPSSKVADIKKWYDVFGYSGGVTPSSIKQGWGAAEAKLWKTKIDSVMTGKNEDKKVEYAQKMRDILYSIISQEAVSLDHPSTIASNWWSLLQGKDVEKTFISVFFHTTGIKRGQQLAGAERAVRMFREERGDNWREIISEEEWMLCVRVGRDTQRAEDRDTNIIIKDCMDNLLAKEWRTGLAREDGGGEPSAEQTKEWYDQFKSIENGIAEAKKWRDGLNMSHQHAQYARKWYDLFKGEGVEVAKKWKEGLDFGVDQAEYARKWYDSFNFKGVEGVKVAKMWMEGFGFEVHQAENARKWYDSFRGVRLRVEVAKMWKDCGIRKAENARKWYDLFEGVSIEVAREWILGLRFEEDEAENARKWYDLFEGVSVEVAREWMEGLWGKSKSARRKDKAGVTKEWYDVFNAIVGEGTGKTPFKSLREWMELVTNPILDPPKSIRVWYNKFANIRKLEGVKIAKEWKEKLVDAGDPKFRVQHDNVQWMVNRVYQMHEAVLPFIHRAEREATSGETAEWGVKIARAVWGNVVQDPQGFLKESFEGCNNVDTPRLSDEGMKAGLGHIQGVIEGYIKEHGKIQRGDDEEKRKKLLAALKEAASLANYDNIDNSSITGTTPPKPVDPPKKQIKTNHRRAAITGSRFFQNS